jgi:Protein of unknown function (DUF4238)
LSHIEDKAPRVLRSIDELWPLEHADKAILAELFGYQVVRGPRWMSWHEQYATATIAKAMQRYPGEATALDEVHRSLVSPTGRLTKMLDLGVRISSILGSMHWTLIEFSTPVLATSDEPVVGWPGDEAVRSPGPSQNDGLLNVLEVRAPVSPRHAILMTWLDRHDAETPRVQGARDHAAPT